MKGNQLNPKRVYTVEHLELQDGTVMEAKPLTIKRSRRAGKFLETINTGYPEYNEDGSPKLDKEGNQVYRRPTEDEVVELFMNIVLVGMEGQESCKKFFESTDEEPNKGRELLEDALDERTMLEIVKITTGADFLTPMELIQNQVREQIHANGGQKSASQS